MSSPKSIVQKVLGNDSLDSIFDQMSLEYFLKVAFFSEFLFLFLLKLLLSWNDGLC
jgi:hypothetical protein